MGKQLVVLGLILPSIIHRHALSLPFPVSLSSSFSLSSRLLRLLLLELKQTRTPQNKIKKGSLALTLITAFSHPSASKENLRRLPSLPHSLLSNLPCHSTLVESPLCTPQPRASSSPCSNWVRLFPKLEPRPECNLTLHSQPVSSHTCPLLAA